MLKQTIANHSEPMKLNLQFFAGEEDAILPDDYVADSNPFEEESMDTLDQEPSDADFNTNETDDLEVGQDGEQQPTPEQLRFKVKYNHEEQELGYDEAVPLIQKGMNYDKLQEQIRQLESDPRLGFIEELANEQGMDVNEYLQAVRTHREDAKLQELLDNNIPEEYAREMLESRKDREERQKEKVEKSREVEQQKEAGEFFEYFKQTNGRDYDSSKDKIPQEVWEANKQGTPMKYAYMQHHANELKSQLKTFKQNETNTKRAPINGVTGFGGDEPTSNDPFLTGFDSI